MLYSLLAAMRFISRSFALFAAGVVFTPTVTRAQAPGMAGGQPGACVAASGPDSGTARGDTALRPGRRDSTRAGTQPTVVLLAAVHADEVRFDRQPRICVTLRGDVRLDSVRVTGRRNITSPVVRGTTYRDVYVSVEILGHLNAECISARITGTTPSVPGACASIEARDSTAGRRTGAPPP
jgi:hypothetical protein